MIDALEGIVEALKDLKTDNTVPKNIRLKVDGIIQTLKDNSSDLDMKISKVQQELDEISEDSNIQAYTRTQIWNITSLLETL